MSQHHLGLHDTQLFLHFFLYMPCDTKCRTFFGMPLKTLLIRDVNFLSFFTWKGKVTNSQQENSMAAEERHYEAMSKQ